MLVSLKLVQKMWGAYRDDIRWLLILDQVSIHKTRAGQEALNKKETPNALLIPNGLASIVQPADVCKKKPFQDAQIINLFLLHVAKGSHRQGEPEETVMPTFFIKGSPN